MVQGNKEKGFTLVELLVAISLLAILTLIAIPTLRAFQAQNDKKTYENYGKSMATSAKLYNDSYSEDLFGNLENGCQKVTLTEMINKKVAKDITLKDVTCNNPAKDSYVLVWKYNKEYAFDPVVNCENSKGAKQYEDTNEALAESCITTTGKPYIKVNTVTNEANNTKKKSVVITINDEFGFTANQEIQYAWSTINNDSGSGVSGYKTYNFNNSYIKRSNGTVVLKTNSITIPSEITGTYYLYIKPTKVQNIINESITNIYKFGPYRFDHEPPACPTITAKKEDGTKVNKETAAQISTFDIKFSADDLQNYEFKISYDNGSTWTTTEYSKDKTSYTPTRDGKIIIKTRGRDYANNLHSDWCTSDMYIRDTTPPTSPTVKGYKKTNATDVSSKGSLAEQSSNTWLKGWIYTEATGSTEVNGNVTYQHTISGAQTLSTTNGNKKNLNTEGTTTIKYRACDSINNCSAWVSYIAKLDRTAPSGMSVNGYLKTSKNDVTSNSGLSTYTANTWSDKWVFVKASGATDALSNGVNYYYGSTRTSYANINSQGTTTAKFKVCDDLDNCTSETSFVVKLDRCEATTTTWGNYGDCSKKCGSGTKTRKGTKYSSVSGHTDHKCSNDNSETDTTSCNTQDCCSDVTYKDGTNCSTTCGTGTKNRLAYSSYDGSRCPSSDKNSGGGSCTGTSGCSAPGAPSITGKRTQDSIMKSKNDTVASGAWSNGVTLTFSSSDPGGGVVYKYTVNSGTETEGSSKTLSTAGTHTVKVKACNASNKSKCSSERTYTAKIDTTAPTINFTSSSGSGNTIDVYSNGQICPGGSFGYANNSYPYSSNTYGYDESGGSGMKRMWLQAIFGDWTSNNKYRGYSNFTEEKARENTFWRNVYGNQTGVNNAFPSGSIQVAAFVQRRSDVHIIVSAEDNAGNIKTKSYNPTPNSHCTAAANKIDSGSGTPGWKWVSSKTAWNEIPRSKASGG